MNIFSPFNDRTEIEPLNFPFKISYQTNCLFLGSCFSNDIGSQIKKLKFPTLINPFGTIYNPVSIYNTLKIISEKQRFSLTDIDTSTNTYFSYYFNTDFSSNNSKDLLGLINNTIEKSHCFLAKTDVVFVTLGTAFVYELIDSGMIVSNCHKQPAKLFTRKLMNSEKIETVLRKIIDKLREKKVVFTVSPIRHIKDGLVANQRSKALLITAVHKMVEQFENVFYFPAYEMVIDDLRDYRYYDKSLTHINEMGIHYIFNKFIDSFVESKDIVIMKEIDKLNKMINHKVSSKTVKKEWDSKVLCSIKNIEKKYSFIDFSEERALIS